MSKAPRTQRRYRKSHVGQTTLDPYLGIGEAAERTGKISSGASPSPVPIPIPENIVVLNSSESESSESNSDNQIVTKRLRQSSQPESRMGSRYGSPLQSESPAVSSSNPGSVFVSDAENSMPNPTLASDEESELEHNNDAQPNPVDIAEVEAEIEGADEIDEENGEAWEDELEENVYDPQMEIRLWDVLKKQLEKALNDRTLPRSRVNQLTVLGYFANLRLKGYSRITASHLIATVCKGGEGKWFARRVRELARHYQIFEDLPKERRGGSRVGRSWIHHEGVRPRVREFLNALPAGKVTPRALVKHINGVIFPELSITPKKPLSERTGQRWLLKMGWRHSLVKKGVYMDGHERADVVKYRDEEFLPLMKKYEDRMTHYEGLEMKRQPPTLASGVREMIAMFHDESCFHANDNDRKAWYVLISSVQGMCLTNFKGYQSANSLCEARAEGGSSMSQTSSILRLDGLSSKTRMVT